MTFRTDRPRPSFKNWLRRICGRPQAMTSGTWDEWEQWEQKEKSEAPLLFWILNTGLPALQRAAYYPFGLIDNIRWFIRNRFFLPHSHNNTHRF